MSYYRKRWEYLQEWQYTTFVISRIIERIGDHAERFVDNANMILKRDIDPSIMSTISKASELSIWYL